MRLLDIIENNYLNVKLYFTETNAYKVIPYTKSNTLLPNYIKEFPTQSEANDYIILSLGGYK